MFGMLFKEITGKSASECESVLEVENVVEKTRGLKKLKVVLFESGVVHKRGNVFRYTNASRDLDAELDKALGIHR